MQAKKILLVSLVGLIVVCGIIAAGCTATVSVNPSQSTSGTGDSSIAGTWTASELDDGVLETKTLIINQDGTGVKKTEKGNGKITIEQFTWSGSAPVYDFAFENGFDHDTYTLINGTLVHDDSIYTRGTATKSENNTPQVVSPPVSIAGTWTASEWDDGAIETKTLTINQDGTGTYLKDEGNGKMKYEEFTWKELGNGQYLFIFSSGDTDTYVYSNGYLYHDDNQFTKK